ncbi:MAG: hypothetical protein U0791_26185 [Gemmataceae bacterium]
MTTRPFEACLIGTGSVNKYQTVGFDGNRYSVPRRFAFRTVTVKGFIDRVEIVAEQRVVATHARSYGRHERVLDPLHFLVILERKPAALDHAPVYRDWQLPAAFATLRKRLEADHGLRTGSRHFIVVLQLLSRFPVENVEHAITQVLARGDPATRRDRDRRRTPDRDREAAVEPRCVPSAGPRPPPFQPTSIRPGRRP